MTVAMLLGDQQMVRQLLIQHAPVGESGQAVLIGLAAQFFTARSLFGEQGFELLDHLVHCQHHAFQFRRAGQFRQAQKLAFTDGLGLFDQRFERTQLPTQQPATEHGAEQSADQQPDQTAESTVPEFGQGELRIAQHFDPCRLLPAAHDQCVATFMTQIDQADKPSRHAFGLRRNAAFYQHLLIVDADDADVAEIATVENRTDHQLHHRRVIDLRGQRQSERGGRVLGVSAQLAECLLARAFQADKKTAAERHQQKQADGEKQLVAQFHSTLLAAAFSHRPRRSLRPASFAVRLASATVFSSRCCVFRHWHPAGTDLRH
ncbi:hypothetical protein D3C81_918670 [compost metagenome]